MKVIERPTVFFDVDDTLVMWNQLPDHPNSIEMNCFGFNERLVPHEGHIKQMKDHKFRGHHVVVWSAGGWEWARAVVIALGLDQYVDEVMDKPHWFYDDLRSDQFMPESIRIYFETYKSKHKGHGEDNGSGMVPKTVYATAHTDIEEGSGCVIQGGIAYPI